MSNSCTTLVLLSLGPSFEDEPSLLAKKPLPVATASLCSTYFLLLAGYSLPPVLLQELRELSAYRENDAASTVHFGNTVVMFQDYTSILFTVADFSLDDAAVPRELALPSHTLSLLLRRMLYTAVRFPAFHASLLPSFLVFCINRLPPSSSLWQGVLLHDGRTRPLLLLYSPLLREHLRCCCRYQQRGSSVCQPAVGLAVQPRLIPACLDCNLSFRGSPRSDLVSCPTPTFVSSFPHPPYRLQAVL
ncbi:hypothetical protein BHM03_00042445 [Ensete ventricosum]|nr:hypothetical protein BHM03_00042445 [Ensete ventricosum]